eukprot:CAMPEP_0204823370 /NCGR_PEP_ID=MMETSP1346-20131115/1412_1 /ASSEMBLY_ACC=CAM_ASM_000771 /TAXON_ID=215587 /ORGANISM="Aplanochytrium stocchinoi, Strain GSBS06" /LENGTH=288 /DNA_ID=CAMNT_0051949961 /DNA_START=106 /DNA_END=972 /DNA_ORIENTATION=-
MSLALVSAYGSSSDEEEDKTEQQQEEQEKTAAEHNNNNGTESVKTPLSFQALPVPVKLTEEKNKKKKKKKKKKHRERRDKERDEGGKKKINVLSLKFEENAVQSMTSSHNEKEDSSIAEEEDKYMSGVGPQRPAQIIDYNYIHGDNTDKNSNNRDNPWGGQSFGSRYMDRDVQNYLESGGDISKLAQHPQFSHLNGADVEKEAKLKAMEISADGSGTAGMGEDRPAVSTFWNVKEGKMTTGFINNTMGKRKHQIGSLVQEAEQFEAELERQKVKSRKGMQKARNMYGF